MENKITREELNQISSNVSDLFNKHFGNMFGSSPAYTYYQNNETKDKYFYTKEKINHKGSPRYVAGIYRFIKTRKQFKLVKQVGFAKKKKAIAWALKMKEKENN